MMGIGTLGNFTLSHPRKHRYALEVQTDTGSKTYFVNKLKFKDNQSLTFELHFFMYEEKDGARIHFKEFSESCLLCKNAKVQYLDGCGYLMEEWVCEDATIEVVPVEHTDDLTGDYGGIEASCTLSFKSWTYQNFLKNKPACAGLF
jgi:hypothetical protein